MLAAEPALTSSFAPRPGGIDPLGLRQINFDLMDRVFPGLNNVARHIRPFTVVTWAWHRAAACAREMGQAKAQVAVLQDFVDRIEVIYAWSQFRRNGNADLPGRDVLAPVIAAGHYEFGGDDWHKKCETRRYSTALSSPINYGPALKALGWVQQDDEGRGALRAMPVADNAIAAFESQIACHLGHPAFCKFGPVSVTNADVDLWAKTWLLESPTTAEQTLMTRLLTGEAANKLRRDGIMLAVAASQAVGSVDVLGVRRTMCGSPTAFVAPSGLQTTAQAWRAVQVRQAFRLALEALFHWVLRELDRRPATTSTLVERFLAGAGDAPNTAEWLQVPDAEQRGPADRVDHLEKSLAPLGAEPELLCGIRKTLAMSIAEAPAKAGAERYDRLPLARAAKEARERSGCPPAEFMAHVIESWVFGQHAYWSIGRGLADARGHGKTILRLKATREENGWRVAPGANVSDRSAPAATGDRLETALTLAREAGLIT